MELNDSTRKITKHTVVTCVYCGHEYPDGTPSSKHKILTEHIKTCAAHPMRNAARKAALFDAIENAARDLPEGWQIVLKIECGWAGLEVVSPDSETESVDDQGRSLADQITSIVDVLLKDEFESQAIEA